MEKGARAARLARASWANLTRWRPFYASTRRRERPLIWRAALRQSWGVSSRLSQALVESVLHSGCSVAFGRKLSDALYIVSFQQVPHPRSGDRQHDSRALRQWDSFSSAEKWGGFSLDNHTDDLAGI